MDRYNVLAGLCDNSSGHIMAYKEEVKDNDNGLYYKVEDIELLQLELLETREQNDRLQKRCEELEKENSQLKRLMIDLKIGHKTINDIVIEVTKIKEKSEG